MTSKDSFKNVDNWLNTIDGYPNTKGILKVLVGCKSDQEASRQITKEEAVKKGMGCDDTVFMVAKEREMLYFETSALKATGVKELFQAITERLLLTEDKSEKQSASTSAQLLHDRVPKGNALPMMQCC